jgi:pilus assembly protein Flp/PilA
MRPLFQKLARFLSAEDGPTAVEYAVMLALLILVCMVAVSFIGNTTSKNFNATALTMAGG